MKARGTETGANNPLVVSYLTLNKHGTETYLQEKIETYTHTHTHS